MDEQARILYIETMVREYSRGLITGVEFLAELTAQVKEIEYKRSDSTIKTLGL